MASQGLAQASRRTGRERGHTHARASPQAAVMRCSLACASPGGSEPLPGASGTGAGGATDTKGPSGGRGVATAASADAGTKGRRRSRAEVKVGMPAASRGRHCRATLAASGFPTFSHWSRSSRRTPPPHSAACWPPGPAPAAAVLPASSRACRGLAGAGGPSSSPRTCRAFPTPLAKLAVALRRAVTSLARASISCCERTRAAHASLCAEQQREERSATEACIRV
mmetsp:Transcript_90044/g.263239  ORF Transcript_90044/g.263239 Transcript_90044/m.263239 type:complete len:225 (-) Transcript_90044:1343-2017(-)